MKIAVVGAGYAGLAAVWYLLKKGHEVVLFDKEGIGGGASGISTGLLHTCPGKHAKLSWRADEGMRSSLELLQIASHSRPVYVQNGILRYDQWISEGITVFSKLYLTELWKMCRGAQFVQQEIGTLDELASFDRIILTAGPGIFQWAELPVKTNIGQALLCRSSEPLAHSFLGQGHITPTEDPLFCHVGSTYEHTDSPDPQKALDLLKQVALFYPKAAHFEVVAIHSGVRVSPTVGYKPILAQLNEKTWALTGFGSRGLLYHALFAKTLAEKL